MSYLSLSSSIDLYGRTVPNPSWEQIVSCLNKLKSESGSIRISVVEPPAVGPETLSVRGDSGHYLITMLDNINDDEEEIRSLFFKEKKGLPQVDILGDYWDPQIVTDDLDLVVRIFKEFYETGNVSQGILSS